MSTSAIEQAVMKCGGTTKLAQGLGLPMANVWQWKTGRRRVPAEWCPDIERLTGVRCEDLRPDINWGVLRTAAQAEAA